MGKAEECELMFRKDSCDFGFDYAPDPFSRLHNSYSLAFRIVDFILRKFRGEPRVYSPDPKYCADLSVSAKMLRHYSTQQEWPESFRVALDSNLATISTDELRLALKQVEAQHFESERLS